MIYHYFNMHMHTICYMFSSTCLPVITVTAMVQVPGVLLHQCHELGQTAPWLIGWDKLGNNLKYRMN